jgi:hypothetical protein
MPARSAFPAVAPKNSIPRPSRPRCARRRKRSASRAATSRSSACCPTTSPQSAYRVTPVVGLVAPPFELTAESNEVAEIFEVPLAFLMDGMNHQRMSFDLPEGAGRRSFYAMPYERFFIWGATAGMLRNLFHLLRA